MNLCLALNIGSMKTQPMLFPCQTYLFDIWRPFHLRVYTLYSRGNGANLLI